MESKLHHLDMWVQIHDMQNGFRSEQVVKDIGNYIGIFVNSDPKNFAGDRREYLRVMVTIDIEMPLKRKMKIKKKGGEWFWVTFKYEHVPTFCFIYGIVGHSERFCPKLFEQEGELTERPYGPWPRAITRRSAQTLGSKWLKSEPVTTRKSDGLNLGEKRVESGQRNAADNQEKKMGTDNADGEKSGMMDVDENLGKLYSNMINKVAPGGIGVSRGNNAYVVGDDLGPNGGIIISDPKCRRTEEENAGPGNIVNMGLNQDGLPKNGQVAGSGLQARQQL